MATLPTVRVKDPSTPGGFLTLNESDFNPAVHKLFGVPDEPPPPGSAEPPSEAQLTAEKLVDGKADDVIPAIAAQPFDGEVFFLARDIETRGKNRKTVLEALDARLSEKS